jgi:hypothetical protein
VSPRWSFHPSRPDIPTLDEIANLQDPVDLIIEFVFFVFELKIGKLDSVFDSMKLLRPLLHDMEPGLQKLKPSKEGKSTVTVLENYDLVFGENGGRTFPMT